MLWPFRIKYHHHTKTGSALCLCHGETFETTLFDPWSGALLLLLRWWTMNKWWMNGEWMNNVIVACYYFFLDVGSVFVSLFVAVVSSMRFSCTVLYIPHSHQCAHTQHTNITVCMCTESIDAYAVLIPFFSDSSSNCCGKRCRNIVRVLLVGKCFSAVWYQVSGCYFFSVKNM